jgi:CsoR family transcriptional regulator, copper-sensing transcriptional repressor
MPNAQNPTRGYTATRDDHAHHCVIGAETAPERDEKTAELMGAVGRLMRSG